MPFREADIRQEEKELEELLKDSAYKKVYDLFVQEYELKKMLAQARKEQNLTQQELSKRTGLSQQAISRIENLNDSKGFTFRTLFKYLEGIGYELSLQKSIR